MEHNKAHSEEYFNDSRNFWWNRDFLELMSKRCRFNSIDKVLDVGSGQGHWIQALLPFLPSKAEVAAVEPEEKSRMIGGKRLQGRVRFVNGTAEKLPFPDNHFDMVTCQTLLIHVTDPLVALKEMLRVLKPGGLILAVEPNNLFGELVRDSLSHAKPIEEQLENLRFVLRCHQGKATLGEGERNRGDFLVQYFLKCGVVDVSNCLSDKTSPLYPPYEKEEQKAVVHALKEAYKSRQFYWAEDETKRFFLAGGGSAEEFQRNWARFESDLGKILQGSSPDIGGVRVVKSCSWTEGNIKNFLGEPDLLVKNPHYRSAAEMKLYSIDRVVSIESTDEFQTWQKNNKARREKLKSSTLKAMEKRRKELLQYVDALEIEIPKFEKNKLRKHAVQSYNHLWESRGRDDKVADLRDSNGFLDRISVNFLRHECSGYEHQIDMMFGKVGNEGAYHHLKYRILEKIAEQYPFLKDECFSQMA